MPVSAPISKYWTSPPSRVQMQFSQDSISNNRPMIVCCIRQASFMAREIRPDCKENIDILQSRVHFQKKSQERTTMKSMHVLWQSIYIFHFSVWDLSCTRYLTRKSTNHSLHLIISQTISMQPIIQKRCSSKCNSSSSNHHTRELSEWLLKLKISTS